MQAIREDRAGRRIPLRSAAGASGSTSVSTTSTTSVRWSPPRAAAGGLDPARVSDLVVAASELAANSILHGGGRGLATVWDDGSVGLRRGRRRGHDPRPDGRPGPTGPDAPKAAAASTSPTDSATRWRSTAPPTGTRIRLRMERRGRLGRCRGASTRRNRQQHDVVAQFAVAARDRVAAQPRGHLLQRQRRQVFGQAAPAPADRGARTAARPRASRRCRAPACRPRRTSRRGAAPWRPAARRARCRRRASGRRPGARGSAGGCPALAAASGHRRRRPGAAAPAARWRSRSGWCPRAAAR